MNDNINVNDGNGLYDNCGLIDSLIVDCNSLPKLLFDNRNVAFCGKLVEMVQKLSNLKDGVKNEKEHLQEQLDFFLNNYEKEEEEKAITEEDI